ncbi:MAG: uracil-DNA glycosylase [Candidatus Omnitrophica bacterium]|nr:uracil-DNA glycosylase [Candidatus Omnitrophota bacterium]
MAFLNYSEFARQIRESDCRKCGLHKTRTSIVVDRGNPDAKILLIGEAPGKDEDETGKPFVGRSGKLLDQIFSEAGINTDKDCLIINVLKCRPPANRTPTPEEAETCYPFLLKQISLSACRTIVLLGRTALLRIEPKYAKVKMTDLFAVPFTSGQFPDKEILVLFHPAYILRNRGKKPLMVEAVSKHLKKLVQS